MTGNSIVFPYTKAYGALIPIKIFDKDGELLHTAIAMLVTGMVGCQIAREVAKEKNIPVHIPCGVAIHKEGETKLTPITYMRQITFVPTDHMSPEIEVMLGMEYMQNFQVIFNGPGGTCTLKCVDEQ